MPWNGADPPPSSATTLSGESIKGLRWSGQGEKDGGCKRDDIQYMFFGFSDKEEIPTLLKDHLEFGCVARGIPRAASLPVCVGILFVGMRITYERKNGK